MVQLGEEKKPTFTDNDGRWMVKLSAHQATTGLVMTVKTAAIQYTFKDVKVGEVWVASGQSNMEFRLASANAAAEEIANPEPGISMFTAQQQAIDRPQLDVPGDWQNANPQTVGRFSAVGYFFAKELHQRLHIPIGIIHTSWGGTPAEAWTSIPALSAEPKLKQMVDNYLASLNDYPARFAAFQTQYRAWTDKIEASFPENKGEKEGWAAPEAPSTEWHTTNMPNQFTAPFGSEILGAAWFRRNFEVAPTDAGKPARINLGVVDDFDITYVNGVKVGGVGLETANAWDQVRNYEIPAGLLKAGNNTVAVRIFNQAGPGGFKSVAKELYVSVADKKIPLAGTWLDRIEVELKSMPKNHAGPQPQPPYGPNHPHAPGALYNGMIAPFIPYGIKGAIWYQGESNADRAYQYRTLFPAMISDWRRRWGQGDFPFYFVQLANYQPRANEPRESAWAELREAQNMTLEMPNTGQAVIIDIGEGADIHPKNKQDVGKRLSRIALAKNYGWAMEYSGPVYAKATFSSGFARLNFTHAEGLNAVGGGEVKGFQIAGADRKWYWASARIEGSTIVVQSPSVSNPVAVRYAWADNPDCNLVNTEGIPASPFRTDDWPGVTEKK